jgi:hypothetical protein
LSVTGKRRIGSGGDKIPQIGEFGIKGDNEKIDKNWRLEAGKVILIVGSGRKFVWQ